MTLDFTLDGKVQVQMFDYIDMTLQELPEDMADKANTAALDHLFQVNEAPALLDEATTITFHHNVARLLFLCKWARP